MNSKNSRTTDAHKLLLNLTDKIDFELPDGSYSVSDTQDYSCMTSLLVLTI